MDEKQRKNIHEAAKVLGMSPVATNVGELRRFLELFPDDCQIMSAGADIGGYDVTYRPYVHLKGVDNTLCLGHLEEEAYKMKLRVGYHSQKGILLEALGA